MLSNKRGKTYVPWSLWVLHIFFASVWYNDTKCFLLFLILPSCGHFWGCRAKHQKLKTGNDQSPGDKKTETEADPRMFKSS